MLRLLLPSGKKKIVATFKAQLKVFSKRNQSFDIFAAAIIERILEHPIFFERQMNCS